MTPKDLMRLALEAGFDVRPGRDGPWDIWATDHSFNRLAELLASDSRQEVALGQAYLDGLEEGHLTKLLMESCDKGTTCPDCEYHKQRAALWRHEAYRLGGTPLPWDADVAIAKAVAAEREACAKVCEELDGYPWAKALRARGKE